MMTMTIKFTIDSNKVKDTMAYGEYPLVAKLNPLTTQRMLLLCTFTHTTHERQRNG